MNGDIDAPTLQGRVGEKSAGADRPGRKGLAQAFTEALSRTLAKDAAELLCSKPSFLASLTTTAAQGCLQLRTAEDPPESCLTRGDFIVPQVGVHRCADLGPDLPSSSW